MTELKSWFHMYHSALVNQFTGRVEWKLEVKQKLTVKYSKCGTFFSLLDFGD